MAAPYVEYGGLTSVPGPLRLRNATLWGFFAEADHSRLEALCRRVFAEPTGGEVDYRPVGSHVMLTWGVIREITSEIPAFATMGTVTEPQVAVWIPVVAVSGTGGRLDAPALAMFVPYMWLENALSLTSGREMYGFGKGWGHPVFPVEGQPDSWRCDAFGMNFGHGEQPSFRPVLQIDVAGGAPGGAPSPEARQWTQLHELAEHFAGHTSWRDHARGLAPHALGLVRELWHNVTEHGFAEVFLKQMRSIEDGTQAALQQVVEARWRVDRLRGGPDLREHHLRVLALDSHPVGDDLGLRDQSIRLSYRIDMDFTLLPGRVLWPPAGGR
jgi:hypothetical protein